VLVALLVNLATHLLERQVLAWHHARGVVH